MRQLSDFRFDLMRLRDNAESIALYRGEPQERAQICRRFEDVYSNYDKLIKKQRNLNLYQRAYIQLTLVLPVVILAQAVLSGELLDATQHWEKVLSMGAQQRLSFARLLVHLPRFVILDEATSALEDANEAALYEPLKSEGVTLISIAHRAAVVPLHTHVLQFGGDAVGACGMFPHFSPPVAPSPPGESDRCFACGSADNAILTADRALLNPASPR